MSRCPICATPLMPVRGGFWRCPMERSEVDPSSKLHSYARRIGVPGPDGKMTARHGYLMLWAEEELAALDALADHPPPLPEIGPERTWIVWGLTLFDGVAHWEALLLRNGYAVARSTSLDRAVAAERCYAIAELTGIVPATWEVREDDGDPE